jgi:peptidoglycan hydrolase-like protein with peptidoglycan-binding domain
MNGWTRIPTVTLRQGSSGICVRELQEDLASFGIPDQYDPAHFIDGQFGPNTEAMLKDVQAQTHVAGGADGVVGRNTWTMLIATTSGD